MTRGALLVALITAAAAGTGVHSQTPPAEPTLDEVVARASAYVSDYVGRSSLLVAEERYVQEIRRPDNNPVAGNLSRSNPGGDSPALKPCPTAAPG